MSLYLTCNMEKFVKGAKAPELSRNEISDAIQELKRELFIKDLIKEYSEYINCDCCASGYDIHIREFLEKSEVWNGKRMD
jgi:hypothetical protein